MPIESPFNKWLAGCLLVCVVVALIAARALGEIISWLRE
jgi:hypothetical protein